MAWRICAKFRQALPCINRKLIITCTLLFEQHSMFVFSDVIATALEEKSQSKETKSRLAAKIASDKCQCQL